MINKIIYHCSDSDIDTHNDISVIREWHINERGWSDVGYHFFIRRDGSIQTGRPLSKIGAHTKGHNKDSIGVCLHGKNYFTKEQFESAKRIFEMISFFKPHVKAYGHRDFNKEKTCPNFEVAQKIYGKN